MAQDAAARERLRALVGNWGREVVSWKLGLAEEELDAVLSGESAMDADTRQRSVDVWQELAGDGAGGDDTEGLFAEPPNEDLDQALIAEEAEEVWRRVEEEDAEVEAQSPSPPQSRATPEVATEGIELSALPGLAGPEQQERSRALLIRVHHTARMEQHRLGLSDREKLDIQLVMVQIEMSLIIDFRESLPEPGQNWDADRRDKENKGRLTLFRLLEQKQKRNYSGLKGAWNRLMGRRKPTVEEVWRRLIERSEAMMLGMESESDQGH